MNILVLLWVSGSIALFTYDLVLHNLFATPVCLVSHCQITCHRPVCHEVSVCICVVCVCVHPPTKAVNNYSFLMKLYQPIKQMLHLSISLNMGLDIYVYY